MIRVLIADDHPVVRQGLKQILEEPAGIVVRGEATNAQEVLDQVRADRWDVVILDLNMPGRSGLDLLRELKRERPTLPILVLSVHSEEQFAVRALKAGASGYLTKESVPEELVQAVKKVSGGGKYITPSLAERLAFEVEVPTEKPLHETLSHREYQVLCLIASGKTGKEIAEELVLSVKTISTYRTRILDKMKMKTTVDLIHYALRHRLVD